MHAIDYLMNVLIAVILIVGGYQFYFLSQRRQLYAPFEFDFKIDDLIPFRPAWIWIYTGLFYPILLLIAVTSDSFAKFNHTVFNFIILLAIQLVLFLIFPTQTPERWRRFDANASLSMRFLALVQKYDSRSNCFPSIHVSVATLTSIHLFNNLSPALGSYAAASFLFPLLIGTSAVLTKQHYFVDIIPGGVLGWLVYYFFYFG